MIVDDPSEDTTMKFEVQQGSLSPVVLLEAGRHSHTTKDSRWIVFYLLHSAMVGPGVGVLAHLKPEA